MAKNKGIYIDRSTLVKEIKNICSENWEDYSVSELYEIGNMHRCDIVAEGKKAMLNFFFKTDGATTIQVAGINTEISQIIKIELETKTNYTNDIESKTCSFKKLSFEWSDKLLQYFENDLKIKVQKSEILKAPKHTKFVLTSIYGDKLVINRFENGTIVLQGKPAYIYSEAISFLSYCKDITINDIVENISNFNKVIVKTDDVNIELQRLLINSYDGIDPVILKLLSPAIALKKISIVLEDYSCFVFPSLRALEGYIKWLLKKKNIEVKDNFGGIFKGYNLTPNIKNKINNIDYELEIERIFRYFKDNRHIHFHTQQILIGTKLITSRYEADNIIAEVIELIDSSYKKLYKI